MDRIDRIVSSPSLLIAFLLLLLGSNARAANKAPPERSIKSTLQHVTPIVPQMPLLESGTRGAFEIKFVLGSASVRWDRAPDRGLFLRIQAQPTSGVTLSTAGKGGQVGSEIFVPLQLRKEGGGELLVANVRYAVSSHARARDQYLDLDLAVPLLSSSGRPMLDSGRVTVPTRVETPMRTKIIVLSMIAIAIFLFIVEWVRVDVVAIMMMVSMPLLGLLHSKQTFTGLSSNAVIAIIGVMIVSAGLNKVGLVSRVVRPVITLAGKSVSRLMIALSSLIAVISSVMQNTGAAVLFLPGIRHACKEINTPISRVLMPIGMCAILGGTMTMIGTSPLILLNDILPTGMPKFGLLELTPIGGGFVVAGILYFSTYGMFALRKISEQRHSGLLEASSDSSVYHEMDGPFELQIPRDYVPRGNANTVLGFRRSFDVHIVAIASSGVDEMAPNLSTKVKPGSDICVYGVKENVDRLVEEHGFTLRSGARRFRDLFNPAVAGTTEAVVTPRSDLLGHTIQEIHFRKTFGVTALALYREGRTFYSDKSDIPLIAGDAILLHGMWEQFQSLKETHRNFIFTTPVIDVDVQNPRKASVGILCFLVTLTLMLVSSFYYQKLPYNPIPLSVCLMTGAIGMVLTGVLSIREAYGAVDWRTVFLLGGLIPLGMAVDNTGTAEWIARTIVAWLGDSVTPLVLLTVLATMAGAFCLVISNVGACTLLVPLGVSMATQIGMDPRVAAIVIGMGVSNSFLLPTHQVNALYMGPGDYRTKDYMKIGGMMSLIYVGVLVSMTYLFYLK